MDQNPAHQSQRVLQIRRVATLLLLGISLLFLLSTYFESSFWRAVKAFTEAALIGGLADWFAVTALFRHPLGLPIPHTAIIPKNKERIAQNFGLFIEKNFLSKEIVSSKISSLDLTFKLTQWLGDKNNALSIVKKGKDLIPPVVEVISDQEIRDVIYDTLVEQLKETKIAPVLGKFLKMLLSSDRHRLITNELITIIGQLIEDNKIFIRQKVREETPWFLPDFVDTKIYEKILGQLQGFILQVKRDPNHRIRSQAAEKLLMFVDKLQNNVDYQSISEEIKNELIHSPVLKETFQGFIREIQSELGKGLLQDIGEFEVRVAKLIVSVSDKIHGNHILKSKINSWITKGISSFVDEHRQDIASFISETVRGWNTSTLVDKFELEIGRDLQFIRINGTIVGGIIGLLLFFLHS